jgi:hypothetical protein
MLSTATAPREEERVGAEMENDRVLLETSSCLVANGGARMTFFLTGIVSFLLAQLKFILKPAGG